MVRDFIKWDRSAGLAHHFGDRWMRAYRIARTLPYEPVLLVLDEDLQEHGVESFPRISKMAMPSAPSGDPNAGARKFARLLVNADKSVIVADRACRSQAGVNSLVQLCELLNATLVDQADRRKIPEHAYALCARRRRRSRRPTHLGLELNDFWHVMNSSTAPKRSRKRA